MTVRVRFADLRSVSRSITLDAPISTTTILAKFAEELLRKVLAQHPGEKTISLLAISVSNLEECPELQLELPLGFADESRRPGSKRGMARWAADRAVLRMGCRWIRIGRIGNLPLRSRRVSQARRKGPLIPRLPRF